MNADGSYTRHELAADAHAERCHKNRSLVEILEAIEMESRDGAQWTAREINDAAREALALARNLA